MKHLIAGLAAVFLAVSPGGANAQQDAREPSAADVELQRERAAHDERESNNRDRGFSDQGEAGGDELLLCSEQDALAGRCITIARLPRCPGPDPRCPDPTRVQPDSATGSPQ